MRRLAVWVIVALLVAGCQSADLETRSPDPTPVMAASATAIPKATSTLPTMLSPTAARTPPLGLGVQPGEIKGITIKFWYAADGSLDQEYAEQVADFNRRNVWGVTVETRSFLTSTRLEEQVLQEQRGGSLPHVVAAPLEMLLTWEGQIQALAGLNTYAGDQEWGLSLQEVADFLPSYWQAGQVSQERWGIPANLDPQVIFYNQSWAEELGFSRPPVTTTEFRSQACAALKANLSDAILENNGTGGWILSNEPLVLESWRVAFGGPRLPVELDQPYIFNTPQTAQAFTYLRKLADEGCAWTARNPSPYQYFANRQALFYSGSLSDVSFQVRAMSFAKSGDRWTILPYPSETQAQKVVSSSEWYSILRSKPAEQLAAWLFIRHLMLPKTMARLSVGSQLLPARYSAISPASQALQAQPLWAKAAGWIDQFQPAPTLASWRTARRIFQDAAWQVFQPFTTLEGIPAILAELDKTVGELAR